MTDLLRNAPAKEVALRERCSDALTRGREAIEDPVDAFGFWCHTTKCFARKRLGTRGEFGFEPPDLRYSSFGIAGCLRAHRTIPDPYVENLVNGANTIADMCRSSPNSPDLFYGGIWCLVEAGVTARTDRFIETANKLLSHRRDEFLYDPDLNSGVTLFALATAIQEGFAPDTWLLLVRERAEHLASCVNSRGIVASGDKRAPYHQRLMYSCWGLAGAAAALQRPDLSAAANAILEFVVKRRMDPDGGIRWHSLLEPSATSLGLPRLYPWGSNLYYECHQCFFAIAAHLTRSAPGGKDYRPEAARAINWIFGDNRWGLDLSQLGAPGLPARCISRRGSLHTWRNRFKGFYEVGSYLWALSIMRQSQ